MEEKFRKQSKNVEEWYSKAKEKFNNLAIKQFISSRIEKHPKSNY